MMFIWSPKATAIDPFIVLQKQQRRLGGGAVFKSGNLVAR
jgi:hypothetical protein